MHRNSYGDVAREQLDEKNELHVMCASLYRVMTNLRYSS